MKKLYVRIFIFLIPLVGFVLLFPVDDRHKFEGLNDDCFYHGIWIFDRITQNNNPVDVAFFGSSHTVNGIMDELIGKELADDHLQVANLGYCRYGNNLNYYLLQLLLHYKKPGIIVLEVREDEDRYSHPVFPYLAGAADVFTAWPFFNRDLLSDYFNFYSYRIRLIRNYYLQRVPVPPVRHEEYGYAASPDTMPAKALQEIKIKRMMQRYLSPGLARDFYMAFPRAYLEKISNLCRKNNIELLFLYLPEYGSTLSRPLEWDTYIQYGKVLIPPREIMENTNYWHDDNHLNNAGAAQLSEWIASRIKESD